MHLIMLLFSLGLVWWLRCRGFSPENLSGQTPAGSWIERWQRTLTLFLFPPLLLLLTALSVLCMGPQGQMIGLQAGGFGYWFAVGLLVFAAAICFKRVWQGWYALRQTCCCPKLNIHGKTVRLLDVPMLFAAQVGFWQSELAISQGLLDTLDEEHLEAVLLHEQAHQYYRDTFWFFWLGWIRQVTGWLPYTDELWQELLLLRELRADCWAAQSVDGLLLAESLLAMVNPLSVPSAFCAAFDSAESRSRLQERVEALLVMSETPPPTCVWSWTWFLFVLMPLAMVPLHT